MEKHTVMKHSLAKALMDAGMQHFSIGGAITDLFGGKNDFQATTPNLEIYNHDKAIGTSTGRASSAYDAQAALAGKLLGNAEGVGPNPAQAQLAQNTGNNVANTAALIASSRGANANPGLAAELAARQGGNILQQGAGQEATLQAQQQLAAQQQAGEVLQNISQNANQQYGIAEGAVANANNAVNTAVLGVDNINSGVAADNAKAAGSAGGGLLGGIGSIFGFSKGGMVPHYAGGGMFNYAQPMSPQSVLGPAPTRSPGIGGGFGSIISGLGKSIFGKDAPQDTGPMPGQSAEDYTSLSDVRGQNAGDWKNLQDVMHPPASGPDIYNVDMQADPSAPVFAEGGAVDARASVHVPGKAAVKGDSEKNDTVNAILSPGEDVLPRSVTMAPDAPERAKKFVEALREKQGGGEGYAKVLKAKSSLKDRVARLEKLCSGGMA